MKVAQLTEWKGQAQPAMLTLQEETIKLRETTTRLCTVLESMEKKMCPDPTACLGMKAQVQEVREFQQQVLGGLAVLTTIGVVLGVIGGWALSLYFHTTGDHHHGAAAAASAGQTNSPVAMATGLAQTSELRTAVRMALSSLNSK